MTQLHPPESVSAALKQAVADAASVILRDVLDRPLSPRVKMLDVGDVCQALGISKKLLYEMIADCRFPKGAKIGASQKWSEARVIQWIEYQQKLAEGGQ